MATALTGPTLLLLQPRVKSGYGSQNITIWAKPCLSFKRTFFVNRASVGFFAIYPASRFPHQGQLLYAASNEVTETEPEQAGEESNVEEVEESDAEDSDDADVEQAPTSVLQTLLHFYKEAIAMNDEMRICDIEAHLRSIENERDLLSQQVATLTEELLIQKERFLRLNADFDNFRKRSEQERLSLASNVQADVIESLFPILDNFERAKSQIKTETEGEEKINNGYQSIYKQFDEIMKALGITVVETVGKRFDPMFHEAIMHEESTDIEEGIIIEEFRRGFKLGDRLLRPAMVKVSAGPGPTKLEEASVVVDEDSKEAIQDANMSDSSNTLDDES